MPTRYAHINIIARDWRRICEFYEKVFDCEPWSSERDHHGPHIDALTNMPGLRVQGRHLRVPGHGPNGPTIEIFTCSENGEDYPRSLNRPGFAHLAFEVDDIESEILRLKKEGFNVLDETPKKGADNKLICFVHPKSTKHVLIELCQEIK